ncbi:hypothetical protein LZ31DRAFT_8281 [Colletotrichum somersetense]|nr:hypothetical protein LZ31DRAFT_8281 [Colletotrichum somersetense]
MAFRLVREVPEARNGLQAERQLFYDTEGPDLKGACASRLRGLKPHHRPYSSTTLFPACILWLALQLVTCYTPVAPWQPPFRQAAKLEAEPMTDGNTLKPS